MNQQTTASTQVLFNVGDRVRVATPLADLKILQIGHGEWNPKMEQCIGKLGRVHRLTNRGDVQVKYESFEPPWTFNAAALKKVQIFNVGDIVTILEDAERVKECQKGHGEWNDNMREVLGQAGEVLKVDHDGDVRVRINERIWTFNPDCCVMNSRNQQELDNKVTSHRPAASHAASVNTEVAGTSTVGQTEPDRPRQGEQLLICEVCTDRQRDTAFDCGHMLCNECARKIDRCAVCREPITKRLPLFF